MKNSMVTNLLLSCLHRNLTPEIYQQLLSVSEEIWEAVLAQALAHNISSIFCHRLQEHRLLESLPPGLRQQILDTYLSNTVINMNLYATLDHILDALLQQDIQVTVLKGAMLAEVVYGNIELREMGDIDLLVPKKQIMLANEILARLGFSAEYERENPLLAVGHLARIVDDNSVHVELHWTITTIDKPHTIDIQPLWDRVYPVQISGHQVFALAPEDLLLHLCYHLSYRHIFERGLRSFIDIDATIEHYSDQLNWQLVINRAYEWRWHQGVYIALRLAHELIGADVPDWVLESLRSSDLDDEIVVAARTTTLATPAESEAMPLAIANFHGGRTFLEKIRILFAAIFLSRKHMALLYKIDPDSPLMFLYYPVRIVDLLSRRIVIMWGLWRDNPDVAGVANRRHLLRQWESK